MSLRRVDAHDDLDFQSWFEVFNRSESLRDGRVGQGWHPDEWRARSVNADDAKVWHLLSYAPVGRQVVAVAAVEVTRDDNHHFLRGELHVDPDIRRKGHGSRALVLLETYAKELGRPQLAVSVMEGATEVGRAPNRYFAPRHGYTIADESIRRDLPWPRPPGEFDGLETQWLPHADGYDIVRWKGPTPEPWVEFRAYLSAVMPAEAPYADLVVDEEVWDRDRVREHERTVDEMGRDLYVAAARHKESGELVGYSELTVSREFTETAYQWDTLVVRAHRGHRLGGLLKLANMRMLEADGVAVSRISTFNSSLNEPMIRVNEELGARVAGAMVLWRKDL